MSVIGLLVLSCDASQPFPVSSGAPQGSPDSAKGGAPTRSPDRGKPAGSKPVSHDPEGRQARADSGQLDGLYWGFKMKFGSRPGQMVTSETYYLFSPDGWVYNDLPRGGGLQSFDFQAAAQRNPSSCGRYHALGGTIQFAWLGGRGSETRSFRVEAGNLWIDNTVFLHIPPFSGLRLKGTYGDGTTTEINPYDTEQGAVATERSITFSPDGTFIDMGAVGTGGPSGTLDVEGSATGRYRVTGNTLELVYPGGQREQRTFFIHPQHLQERPPSAIVIDGAMLMLEEADE